MKEEYKPQGFLRDCLLFQSPREYDRKRGIFYWVYAIATIGIIVFL